MNKAQSRGHDALSHNLGDGHYPECQQESVLDLANRVYDRHVTNEKDPRGNSSPNANDKNQKVNAVV